MSRTGFDFSSCQRWAFQKFSLAYDTVSFLPINLLQLRHQISNNYSSLLRDYVDQHRQTSISEFYHTPSWNGTALPSKGRVSFPTLLPSPFPENNRATFDLYPCPAGWTQPTMLIAHGLMSVSDSGYRRWADRLNQSGWNAVFCHLPYHYSRTPKMRWGGELAVTADLIRVVEGVRQAVVDLRMLMNGLDQQGVPYYGVWGTSYGGWISALLCATDHRVQRALLVEPIVDIESAIWNSPATLGMRHLLRAQQIRPEDARPHLRLCCPHHLHPLLPASNVILVAGEYDQIAPPSQIYSLHQRWSGSHYEVAPQGHVGYTLLPRSLRLAEELWPNEFSLNLNPSMPAGVVLS